MVKLTIRNIPDELYRWLKLSAAQHGHSINREALVCLEQALVSVPIDPEAFSARAAALRAKNPGIFVTDADLQQAKNEGRL